MEAENKKEEKKIKKSWLTEEPVTKEIEVKAEKAEKIKSAKKEEPTTYVVLNSKVGVSYPMPESLYLKNKANYEKDGFTLEKDPIKAKTILDNKYQRIVIKIRKDFN